MNENEWGDLKCLQEVCRSVKSDGGLLGHHDIMCWHDHPLNCVGDVLRKPVMITLHISALLFRYNSACWHRWSIQCVQYIWNASNHSNDLRCNRQQLSGYVEICNSQKKIERTWVQTRHSTRVHINLKELIPLWVSYHTKFILFYSLPSWWK